MIRVVIDTNVLVSAMISLSRNEALLARPKFGFSPDEIAALSDLLQGQGDLVRPSPLSGMSPDPQG